MATWTDHDPKPGPGPSARAPLAGCEPGPPTPGWVAMLLPWLYPAAELTDGPCVVTTEAEAEAP